MKHSGLKESASLAFSLFLFLSVLTGQALAGDTRGYVAPKTEIKGLVFYYLDSSGHEKYRSGEKIADDFNLNSNIQIFRPIYYFKVGTHMATLQSLIPFGNISLDGQDAGNKSYSTSGMADISLLAGLWLLDDPLSKTWFGISEWIKMPTGEYDKKRVLNMGSNQWAFKTELGLIKGLGDFYIELIPSIEFYTDNSDYGPSGSDQEKAQVFVMESHLSYDLTKSFIISLDHYYKAGGKTKVNGTTQDDEANNHSMQLTFVMKTADNQRLLLQYLEDIDIENGPKTSRFGLRYTFLI